MRLNFLIITMLCLAGMVYAQAPSTAPTTQASVSFESDAPARTWFADLASPEDARRQDARTNIMGLSREDLPRLRSLVQENQPLAPAQAAALHEIVLHVYLSGEPYTPVFPPAGFLGISLPNTIDRLGVPVLRRFPGFPSFRMLRDGDLILGVFINPKEPIQELPNMPTRDFSVLQTVIGMAGPNRDVVLEVLRQGQEILVPLRLLPRPEISGAADSVDFFTPRLQKGEDYWRAEFMPLLRTGASEEKVE